MSESVPPPLELHLTATDGPMSVIELLASHTELSKQQLKKIMQQGAVWITRGTKTERVRRAKSTLNHGEILHLYYNPKILAQTPATPHLIEDRGGYSIWYKPYGMLCQGSKWGDHCTINRWIEMNQFQDRPSIIIHRLDRATTGLMILLHKKRLAKSFTEIFENRAITKRYQAIVEGEFPVASPVMTITKAVQDRPAVSHVRRLKYDPHKNQSLIEVEIDTGRKHQIRFHLSAIGWPIVGDRQYGSTNRELDLMLCAIYLAFKCPITDQLSEYTLPKTLQFDW